MLLVFLFLLGTAVGSFLNVLIDRLPRGEKITGRSYCENCKKTLRAFDLIPLLSFFHLRGRCRYCNTKLSYFYPLVELVTGLLFSASFLHSAISQILVINLIFISIMIVVFFTDLKYGIIPDKVVFPGVLLTLIWLVFNPSLLTNHLISAVGSFLFFQAIYLTTRGKGLGYGDVKLSFLIGLFLGIPLVLVSFYMAFLTGAAIGIILILWRKKRPSSPVPFGPFLALSSLLTLFFGDQILSWGLRLLSF